MTAGTWWWWRRSGAGGRFIPPVDPSPPAGPSYDVFWPGLAAMTGIDWPGESEPVNWPGI